MKPFNLEEALAGKPVVCKNGWEVTEIVYMPTITGRLKVLAVAHGVVRAYDREGNLSSLTHTHELQLFMAIEKKSIWINVYLDKDGQIILSPKHDSIESALRSTKTINWTFIKTIEITNEIEL